MIKNKEIIINNLTKTYNKKTILNDLSFKIRPGKFTTLLGANGSGKSTLLNLLSGQVFPDGGEVLVNNESLHQLNFPFAKDIFFIHEKIDYDFDFNIRTFIDLMLERWPNWNSTLFDQMQKERKIDLDKKFQEFSRGQKMQIVLMIAIASQASILLIDEVTSVIDVYGRKYFLDLLEKQVKSGRTVVMTTNIINELEFYTDHLIVLKDSNIVLNQPSTEIPNVFFKIRQPPGVTHPLFQNPACIWAGINSDRSVSYIVPANSIRADSIPTEFLDRRKSSLEDVFIYFFTSLLD